MQNSLRLRGGLATLCSLGLYCALFWGPAALDARTKQGDRLLKEAQQAETREDWDRAVELYQQAVDEDPRDSGYLIGMRRARFQAGEMHVNLGQQFRSEGNIADAIAEFQLAILTDPSSPIALQELRQTQEMLVESGQAGNRGGVLTPIEQARRDEDDRIASILGPPELNPPVTRIPELRMNNQPVRILYDTVARIAGVTVVIDSTWQPPTRNFDVELQASGVEEALDYLALLTRTYWKPISDTTIFVTEDSANKRRDFTDTIVKTFYVTNATTVQEFQEIATAVRTITDIRRVYTYNALKAMVVRGDADAVALSEKLIRDLDKAKAEVVVDVLVMEANSGRTRDLAATMTATGLNLPIAFTPRSSISLDGDETTGAIPIARLRNLSSGDFSTTLQGGLLQAMLRDSTTQLLNSPQVRVSDGMPVTLNIGDRVPIASGSFQSGIGGGGGFPGVNTQFQYIDVGVNVELTPQVHSAEELTLHVDVEVSSVRDFVDLGGIDQPIVGQNHSTADIRLRDGEVTILTGLLQTQQSENVAGLPGLVNIPVLGKILFGNQHTETDRGEMMIALIPHIIRTPGYTRENLRGVYAGSDQVLDLRRATPPGQDVDSAEGEVGNAGQQGLAPTAPAPNAPPATAPQIPVTAPQNPIENPEPGQAGNPAPNPNGLPATAPPNPPAIPGFPGVPQQAAEAVAGAAGDAPTVQARLTFMPGLVTASQNAPFTVNLQIDNAADIYTVMPLRISWDPALLRLNDIAPGELMNRGGGPVTAVKDIRNEAGQATLSMSRPPGGGGVSGTGAIATLTFVGASSGSGSVNVTELNALNGAGQVVGVTTVALPVAIQ